MMTILITGGSGFIGSHLVQHFQGKAAVRVLDNFRSGSRRNLEGFEVDLIEGDVMDRPGLRAAMQGVDYVFHLAAMVSVPESVGQPLECETLNGMGTLHVLEEAAAAGVKKVFFASSAAVYGDNPVVPKLESMLPEPKSPYAITKLLGEYYCRFYHGEGRVPTVCLRFFNVFGPRQDPRGPYAAAVPIFIEKALRGETLTIHGDGDPRNHRRLQRGLRRHDDRERTGPATDHLGGVGVGSAASAGAAGRRQTLPGGGGAVGRYRIPASVRDGAGAAGDLGVFPGRGRRTLSFHRPAIILKRTLTGHRWHG
jgi:dTDP-4-dehydrorhamnose reductase